MTREDHETWPGFTLLDIQSFDFCYKNIQSCSSHCGRKREKGKKVHLNIKWQERITGKFNSLLPYKVAGNPTIHDNGTTERPAVSKASLSHLSLKIRAQ